MLQFIIRLPFLALVVLAFQIGATGSVHAQAQWILATQVNEVEAEINKCDRKIESLDTLISALQMGISQGEEYIIPIDKLEEEYDIDKLYPDSPSISTEEVFDQMDTNFEMGEIIDDLNNRISKAYSEIDNLRGKKDDLRRRLDALKKDLDKRRPIAEIPAKKKVKKLKKSVKKFRDKVKGFDGKIKKIESDAEDLLDRIDRANKLRNKVDVQVSNKPIWFVEGGFGATSPLNSPDLDPNQFIDNTAGISGRLVGGVIWPKAIGNINVGVGIAVIGARTVPDSVGNKFAPGTLNTSGHRDYFGILPSAWVEIPLSDRTNLHLGGGIGFVNQDFNLISAGTTVASANDTTFAGQIGGGLRFLGGDNWDVGIESYATRIGSINGQTSTGTPIKLGGQWDLLTTVSFRYRFGGNQLFGK